ncbi:MAG: ABC transporter substrate-binding protein [Nocardioidaceae bacterium]
MTPNRPRWLAALLATAVLGSPTLAACSVAHGEGSGAGSGDVETITVGYQSKTINTVTAGTLLRSRGYFEKRLAELGRRTGKAYKVQWLDYDTGAPITAQMLAGKIDIGSMGDYPLLINGSTAGTSADGTEMVSVTGYNQRGALNGVVVGDRSPVTNLKGLAGKRISASVGSAGHGTLVQALTQAGIDPTDGVRVENQQPSVGASALEAGSVDAVAQFVAWPGLLAFRDHARLVYDGGQLGVPTLHGVVVRKAFASTDKDVVEAFLRSQLDATNYLREHPLQAAEQVARSTGLPPEVVYLYNGRNGIATFDPTLKPPLVAALHHDLPFLKSIGVLDKPVDLGRFVDPTYLRQVYGAGYAKDARSETNPAAIDGRDQACHRRVTNAATAGEIWVRGEQRTRPTADPVCLLRNVRSLERQGASIRAAYVPDASTGTRWFADRMVWVRDGQRFSPFATQAAADGYVSAHRGATVVSYATAVKDA